MSDRAHYTPGPARGAEIYKDEDGNWTLVLVRQLNHAPEKVWAALTDPAQLREWAPFDASTSLDRVGAVVVLTTVNAQVPPAETRITRADYAQLLEYKWGGQQMRWELAAVDGGTRLTLWHNIDKRYISMGAAGWHICLDVLDHALSGAPLGRIVGPDAMKFGGWQQLNTEYAAQFGVDAPQPPKGM